MKFKQFIYSYVVDLSVIPLANYCTSSIGKNLENNAFINLRTSPYKSVILGQQMNNFTSSRKIIKLHFSILYFDIKYETSDERNFEFLILATAATRVQ